MYKVIELTIDELDEMSGLDFISIVNRPAHESNFLAFGDETYTPIYEQLDEENLMKLSLAITELGEPIGTLEKEGYVLYKIEDALPESEMTEQFASTDGDPNASGLEQDFLPRIRYKYTHPVPAGRVFCQAVIDAQKVYSDEDILLLGSLNPVGPGGYDCLRWRGSFNCRGKWSKLTYLPKDESGEIINSSNSRKGLESEEEGVLFDTRTQTTIEKGNTPDPRVGGWFKKEFGVIEIIDEMPVLETKEQAEILAEKIGCKGTHEYTLENGMVGYMPCDTHGEGYNFETYNDYPKEASENACKVLRWIDEHGRDEVSGMERTGLARANSLCKMEKISTETIGRMASFARHKKNSEINPDFKGTPWKDKGYVAWLAWGGDAGVEWAQRKLDQLAKEMSKEDFSCSCNNIHTKNNDVKMSFSTNEDKMEITGAALIPNKMIIRRTEPTIINPRGEFYYVFFSEETIAKLQEQFMDRKLLDATNIEHSSKLADSYVKESWIVDDPIFDKSSAMGLEFPKGTWVITMKVKNKSVWNDIKEGKLNGFSVEGWFSENLLFNKQ